MLHTSPAYSYTISATQLTFTFYPIFVLILLLQVPACFYAYTIPVPIQRTISVSFLPVLVVVRRLDSSYQSCRKHRPFCLQHKNNHIPTITSRKMSHSSSTTTMSVATTTNVNEDDTVKLRPELVISLRGYLFGSDSHKNVHDNEAAGMKQNKVQLILGSQSPRRKEILDMMGLQSLYQIVVPSNSFLNETRIQEKLRSSSSVSELHRLDPIRYTRTLAEQKAYAVAYEMSTSSVYRTYTNDGVSKLVLGSDTIVVVCDDSTDINHNHNNTNKMTKILEKPKNTDDAIQMLNRLQNTSHTVYTGVAIVQILYHDDNNNNNNNTNNRNDPASASPTMNDDGYYIDGSIQLQCDHDDFGNGQEQQQKYSSIQLVQSFVESATVHFSSLTDIDIQNYVATNEPMDKAGAYGIQGIGGQLISKIDGDYFTVMGMPMHRTSRALATSILDITQR